MQDDIDDLLGDVQPARRRVGRMNREEVLQSLLDRKKTVGGPTQLPRMEEFYKPVGITFLADVFRLDTRTAKKKLADCPVIANEGGGKPLYDFVQAAGYLVKPKLTGFSWLKSLRVQDLPAHLAPGIQSAMLSRQTYELRAGNLWKTEDVIAVFGDLFLTMKDTMQLWAETMRENAGLSDAQWVRFRELVDDLQNKLHAKLVEMPKLKQTRSSLAAIDADAAPFDPYAEGGDND